MRVFVFGDSIAQGFWDIEGGWVARIRKHYDQKKVSGEDDDAPVVFNLGVSAETTVDVANRIDNEIKSRDPTGLKPAVVLAIGVNDTQYYDDKVYSTSEEFRDHLMSLLKIVRMHSDKILFVGLSCVVEERVQPMPWSETGKSYSNKRIWEFEEVLRAFCDTNNVPIVKLYEAMEVEQQTRELLPDGVHPNGEGHQLIADLVLPELEKLIKK